MIYPLGGLLLGAILGAVRARRKGGKPADIAQWAAVHGLMLGVVGLFVLIFVLRSAS